VGEQDIEAIAKPELDELEAVNLADIDEARAWALLLGCSTDQLQQAVRAVGGDPERIRAYLGDTGLRL
jgi:hypothetical protein